MQVEALEDVSEQALKLLRLERAEVLLQRAAHIERMRELTTMRRASDLAESLQADYAIFHLEADLRWIDLTTARLQLLKEEIQGAR